jgi:N-methylhydantoinase A
VAAAEGIYRVVNTNMAEGIKLVSVRRGVDPRRFTLVSFGGAAGLHVTQVARQLEIKRVVVPTVASVLSAWGMLATDLRYELVRSHVSELSRLKPAALRQHFVRRGLDMRYGEQIFEIGVDLDGVDLDAPGLLAEVASRFHQRHEALYAYSAPGQEVVVVNARVAVIGELPVGDAAALAGPGPGATGTSGAVARRRVYLGDWTEVPVYRLDGLGPGDEVKGPALFESATTTVLVRDGEHASVTPQGWLDIAIR